MTDQCERSQGVEGGRRADIDQSKKVGNNGDEDDGTNRDHIVFADLKDTLAT